MYVRAAKFGAGTAMTVLGTVVAQFAYFDSTYKSLSPPKGVTEGVERRRSAPAAHSKLSGQLAKEMGTAGTTNATRVLRIIFVGDSLIAGVGCTQGEAVLPKHVARSIANDLGIDVSWRSWSLVGGDVRQLQDHIMPKIEQFLLATATTPEERVDAVVVMCGLNDWKRVASGTKSPQVFYDDLASLAAALHGKLGPQCRVILPALPLHLTTAFPLPLFSVVVALAEAWDLQKQRLADEAAAAAIGARLPIDCVSCPPDLGGAGGLSTDGIHPNEGGYEIWAEHIAHNIACRFSEVSPSLPPTQQPQKTYLPKK
jgi:lysophospholipase L1-like esterase